jgi:hypothetical protein
MILIKDGWRSFRLATGVAVNSEGMKVHAPFYTAHESETPRGSGRQKMTIAVVRRLSQESGMLLRSRTARTGRPVKTGGESRGVIAWVATLPLPKLE